MEYPIRLLSVFENFCISHCFEDSEQMEKWLNEKKLDLLASYQIGDYLCCFAGVKGLDAEKVL